ncbi:MAG TPA: hypothetical protein VGM90_32940 [Kofleriaceae bacterium]
MERFRDPLVRFEVCATAFFAGPARVERLLITTKNVADPDRLCQPKTVETFAPVTPLPFPDSVPVAREIRANPEWIGR